MLDSEYMVVNTYHGQYLSGLILAIMVNHHGIQYMVKIELS